MTPALERHLTKEPSPSWKRLHSYKVRNTFSTTQNVLMTPLETRIFLHLKLICNIFCVFIMFMHHKHLNNGGLGLSNNLVARIVGFKLKVISFNPNVKFWKKKREIMFNDSLKCWSVPGFWQGIGLDLGLRISPKEFRWTQS